MALLGGNHGTTYFLFVPGRVRKETHALSHRNEVPGLKVEEKSVTTAVLCEDGPEEVSGSRALLPEGAGGGAFSNDLPAAPTGNTR